MINLSYNSLLQSGSCTIYHSSFHLRLQYLSDVCKSKTQYGSLHTIEISLFTTKGFTRYVAIGLERKNSHIAVPIILAGEFDFENSSIRIAIKSLIFNRTVPKEVSRCLQDILSRSQR